MDIGNNEKPEGKLIYADLSYIVNGICFKTHNELGRFSKEKQYGDMIEKLLEEEGIRFIREHLIMSGDRVDFLIEGKMLLEIKAKRVILKEDYYQIQRYLQHSDVKLGLLVNFRNRYIKPKRIIRIDTDTRKKFM